MSILLILLLGCGGLECGPDTHEEDGLCVPDDATVTNDTAGTTEQCEPAQIFDLQVESNPSLVLEKRVDIALDGNSDVSVSCTLDPNSFSALDITPLIERGTTWSYFDTGTDPKGDWTSPEYDDTGWAAGPSPLGYGVADLATTVSWGANPGDRFITTFFRSVFEVDDIEAIKALEATVMYDDGVLLYLNGVEISRENIPTGDLTFDTPAIGDLEFVNEADYELDPTLLVTGTNVIAARVHQSSSTSSDLFFDFSLTTGVEPDEPIIETHYVSSDQIAPFHSLSIYGLLADAEYNCLATTSCEDVTSSQEFSFTTDPLPEDLPSVLMTVTDPDAVWGAYTMFNTAPTCGGQYEQYFMVVDLDGNIRWYYKVPDVDSLYAMNIDIIHLGGDELFWGGGNDRDASPRRMRLNHEITYLTQYSGAGSDRYHHDIHVTEDGQLLGLIDTNNTDGKVFWDGFGLKQHDPETYSVTWEWDSQSAVDAGTLDVAESEEDPYHSNSFSLSEDSDGLGVYVSLLYDNTIVRIDRETGDLTWTLGPGGDFELQDADGTPLGEKGWWSGLHSVQASDDTVIFIDNGQDANASRVMEVAYDTKTMIATVIWEYDDEGWFDRIWGDADILPNDNILLTISNSSCSSHEFTSLEIDRDSKEEISRFSIPSMSYTGYRTERLDGCAIFANSRFCDKL